MEIKNVCVFIKRYAKTMMNRKDDMVIAEACDFGDEYGFLFNAPNIYDNVYWCVNKKTGKITAFSPYQDQEKYSKRKQIALEEVE